MPENWLSALPGPVPASLLQDESSLTSCSACTADLILLQITLVDYSGRLACLVHSPLPFFLRTSSDYLQVFNLKVGTPYCCTFVLLQLTLVSTQITQKNAARAPSPPFRRLKPVSCERVCCLRSQRHDADCCSFAFQTGNTGPGSVNDSYSIERLFPRTVWFGCKWVNVNCNQENLVVFCPHYEHVSLLGACSLFIYIFILVICHH